MDDLMPNEPGSGSKKRNWGVVEWGILLAILGLVIYGQFFGGGGGPC